MTRRALAIDALGDVEETSGASQANGLGSAKAPEPHAGLGPTGAIPSAFTAGPWETERCPTTYYNGPADEGDPCIVTAPDDGVILAVCVPDVVPQVEANARLIAAAPDMFAALVQACSYVREAIDDGALDAIVALDAIDAVARDAIAKARGDAQ